MWITAASAQTVADASRAAQLPPSPDSLLKLLGLIAHQPKLAAKCKGAQHTRGRLPHEGGLRSHASR